MMPCAAARARLGYLIACLAALSSLILPWMGSARSGMRAAAAQQGGSALRRVAVIDLPGPVGKRFDYLTVGEEDNYLFSAHLAAGLLHVIDVRTNTVVKTISGVPGVEGVAYIAEDKKLYTADWWEKKIGVIDLSRMAVVKKIPTEDKPDGIAYAAPFRKAYVSNERARAESVIDVASDTIVKVLRFDSETGVPQYDPVARKVYVNLQDRHTLAVIDPATDTVAARYPVDGCKGNHGMAIGPAHHRAFLSCEENSILAVFDLDAHRAVARLPMARGADVVQFDPGLGRIYVACASGAISVFQMEDPDHFRKVEDFPVEPKIHSLGIDVRSHRLYAPAEQDGGRPASKIFVFEAVASEGGSRGSR